MCCPGRRWYRRWWCWLDEVNHFLFWPRYCNRWICWRHTVQDGESNG